MTSTTSAGFASVNGIRMYYEISGQGAPLVLIHGGGSTIDSCFGRIIPFLSENFTIIAVELQSHGRTEDRPQPESFRQDADDVMELLKQLNIGNAFFFGFSNGGHTSIEIGLRYPQSVKKIVMASSPHRPDYFPEGFFNYMQYTTISEMPAPLKEAYRAAGGNEEGLQVMFEKDRDRMIGFKGWTDQQLSAIQAPVLILSGDQDIITPEHAVSMWRCLPNARLLILPGNHGSFIGEICSANAPSRLISSTAAIVTDFLLND